MVPIHDIRPKQGSRGAHVQSRGPCVRFPVWGWYEPARRLHFTFSTSQDWRSLISKLTREYAGKDMSAAPSHTKLQYRVPTEMLGAHEACRAEGARKGPFQRNVARGRKADGRKTEDATTGSRGRTTRSLIGQKITLRARPMSSAAAGSILAVCAPQTRCGQRAATSRRALRGL